MNEREKGRGCLGWGLRIVGGLLGLIVIVAIVGTIYESRAARAARAQHPAPGELVAVNGRQMHIHCAGEGSPTVILDAGQGGWSIAWTEIMPQISTSTRVCAYDRAGYGWSEPADDARSPQDIADDLAALFDAATIDGPYVIVGFSYTGLSSRLFAQHHPDEVVGMVLVDPATEFDNELMDEVLSQQQRATVGVFQTFRMLAQLGVVRWLDPREMAPYAPFIPQDAAQPDIYYSFIAEPEWWETSTQEFVSRLNDETLDNVRTSGEIPDIPLVIIGAETVGGEDDGFEAYAAAHLEHLQELATRSSKGEFILAEGSTHEVPRDRPDLVVKAILRVVEQVRE